MTYLPMTTLITKLPGASFGARLTFDYKGPQLTAWIGIGLAYGILAGHNPPFVYAVTEGTVGPAADWTAYYIDVEGVVPSDAELGKLLDVQRFISRTQPVAGQQPPNDFGVNAWDDEVYDTVPSPQYRNLVAQYW